MRLIKWMAVNGMIGFFIYAGYYKGIEGAENLLMFIAWSFIVLSFFTLSDRVKSEIKKKERVVPPSVNITVDICIACAFAWFGAWVTAVFWIIHLLLVETAYGDAEAES